MSQPELKLGVVRPQITFPELPYTDTRTHLQILRSNELVRRNNIDILVPHIIQEGFIVDQEHVAEMREDLQGPTGQRGPVQLRAREIDGKEVFEIIDGFHRIEAMGQMGWEKVRANVFYNMPDQVFYDARIKDTTVKSVAWPRIAEWVTKQWIESDWGKQGIRASVAYGMLAKETGVETPATNDKVPSAEPNAEGDQGEMMEWLRDRCKTWKRTSKYIADILRVVEVTDPELINQVRVAENGRGEMDKLTPSRLAAIVDALPGEKNYIYQNVLAQVVVRLRLTATDAGFLSYKLKRVVEDGITEVRLDNLVVNLATEVVRERRNRNRNVVVEETDEDAPMDNVVMSGKGGLTRAVREILSASGLAIFNRDNQGSVPIREGETRQIGDGQNGHDNGWRAETGWEAIKKRRRLQGWWEKAGYLDGPELTVMRELFGRGFTISQLEELYSISAQEAVEAIITALGKQQDALDASTS